MASNGDGETVFELDAEAARSYWTPERRRLARPIEPIGLDPMEADTPPSTAAVEPVVPRPLSNSQRVSNRGDAPWRQVVALFSVINGVDHKSSGVVVGPDLVLTAGHSIFNRESDGTPHGATTININPAFDHGVSPFGEWFGQRVYAPNRWIQNTAFPFDVALVAIARTPRGDTIGGTVGWRGIAASSNLRPPQGFSRAWTGAGYPRSPGHGQEMYNESLSVSEVIALRTGSLIAAVSDFSAGCSGGPWLIDVGGEIMVNGIYSRLDPSNGTQFSPFFGSAIASFLGTHLDLLDVAHTQGASGQV